ncbi:MAG: TonB-dependent receptor, partial [Verrucomicrobiota bacterium]
MKSHSFQTSRWPLACAFLCAMGALFASASPHAAAGEEEATFNIGVQSLNEALIEFGKQTGLSISVDSKTLSGKRSSAVNGSMSLDRAIDKMLEGTGLEHSISGNMLTLREAASGLINLRSARLVGDLASGLTDSDAFSVVEEDVIANQQGSTAVDVFNEMAGVVGINEGGRQTFRINIRGLEGSGRVAIDVDGAQMNQIDHNHGFATNRVLIEPSLIKQVSVVRGPASNKRGGGALAGSVSFTTINPADLFRGGASVGGFFKAGYEENGNGFNSSLGLARRASEKWSFLGAFTYRSYESYEDAEGVEVIASGSRSNSTLLKAVFDASEDQSIKLAYRGEEHNYNGSGAFARGQLRSSNIQDETVDTDTFSIHYTHEGSGQDWLNLNANAYVTDNLRIEQDLDSDSESMDDLRTKGFNVVNSASIFGDAFGSELTYGFDYFKDDLAASSSSPAGERSQYGVFIDGYHKINDSLVVFEGLRFDDFDMSSADGDDLSGDNLSGRIGFELSPFNSSESLENLTFFANYGTGFRTP